MWHHLLFQAMAADIQCWVQSRGRWPLRTTRAPTPVTPGVSGGFGCQRGARCDCCLGILMWRAAQTAAMAPSWSQAKPENALWVSSTRPRSLEKHLVIDFLHSCHYWFSLSSGWRMPFHWYTHWGGKPSCFARDTCTSSNPVWQTVPSGHNILTAHQSLVLEILLVFITRFPEAWLIIFICFVWWGGVRTRRSFMWVWLAVPLY